MKTFNLNNNENIPVIGFGVFMIPNNGPTYEATLAALKAGYRHIDTAAGYMNESDVGKAIKDSGVPREEIFITSKLWLQDYGYENAKKGIDTFIKSHWVADYMELYLLHQPYIGRLFGFMAGFRRSSSPRKDKINWYFKCYS
ncbi:MAG: aldo/keto reductase [Thomasclavelia ramosa]